MHWTELINIKSILIYSKIYFVTVKILWTFKVYEFLTIFMIDPSN